MATESAPDGECEWCSGPFAEAGGPHEYEHPDEPGPSAVCGRCYRGAKAAEVAYSLEAPDRCDNAGCGTGALLDEDENCPRCGWSPWGS